MVKKIDYMEPEFIVKPLQGEKIHPAIKKIPKKIKEVKMKTVLIHPVKMKHILMKGD